MSSPRRNPEPLDGTGVEFPNVAPMEGTHIVNRDSSKKVEEIRKGAKIIGGSQKIGKDGKREGVKIIDRNTKP